MKKPDTDKMSLRMEHIWLEAENRIIEDIVRRIKKLEKSLLLQIIRLTGWWRWENPQKRLNVS